MSILKDLSIDLLRLLMFLFQIFLWIGYWLFLAFLAICAIPLRFIRYLWRRLRRTDELEYYYSLYLEAEARKKFLELWHKAAYFYMLNGYVLATHVDLDPRQDRVTINGRIFYSQFDMGYSRPEEDDDYLIEKPGFLPEENWEPQRAAGD